MSESAIGKNLQKRETRESLAKRDPSKIKEAMQYQLQLLYR